MAQSTVQPFAGLYEISLPATLASQSFSFSPSPEDIPDDELDFSDNEEAVPADQAGGAKRKPRRLHNTAEKRANHNAVERARRESLNVRFMELARALPTMNAKKRPSKNAIVIKSLEYVKNTRAREQVLEEQNAALRAEVNELRHKLGMPARPERAPSAAFNFVAPVVVNKPAAVIPPVVVESKPIVKQEPVTTPSALVTPAALTSTATAQGPYLSQSDSVAAAAAYYHYMDAQRYAIVAGMDQQRRGSAASTDETATNSDSDGSSMVNTPPSAASFSPFFYDEPTLTSSMATPGLASFTTSETEMFGAGHCAPTSWAGMGSKIIGFGPGATLSYSLYA